MRSGLTWAPERLTHPQESCSPCSLRMRIKVRVLHQVNEIFHRESRVRQDWGRRLCTLTCPRVRTPPPADLIGWAVWCHCWPLPPTPHRSRPPSSGISGFHAVDGFHWWRWLVDSSSSGEKLRHWRCPWCHPVRQTASSTSMLMTSDHASYSSHIEFKTDIWFVG